MQSGLVFDVIRINFLNDTEAVLDSFDCKADADRRLAELTLANRQPSTFYYWVARRGLTAAVA